MVMEEGIYAGLMGRSDKALIALESGIVKCRDIRRQLEECRCDKERVMQVKATPMAPTEGAEDMRVKTYIQPGLSNTSVPRPVEEATSIA